MRFRSTIVAALAAWALIAAPLAASAQVYPTNNATYTPTAILPATTFTAPGNLIFVTNNAGVVDIVVSGTNTGLNITTSVSANRAEAAIWTQVSSTPSGGAAGVTRNIIAAGLYRISVPGATQVKIAVTAISTGSVVISASAGTQSDIQTITPVRRVTYFANFNAITPAASANDIITIIGNATTTVRVQRAECWGTATANGIGAIAALKRTTAPTGGTAVPATVGKMDSGDPAASSTPQSYTSNPIVTAGVTMRQGLLTYSNATTTTVDTAGIVWDFGTHRDEEPTLRGVAQAFSINLLATSVPSGGLLTCNLQWSED